MEKQLLTTAEVAELLRLNERTVRQWVKEGKIPHRRIGGRILYPADEIERFIEAHPGARYTATEEEGQDTEATDGGGNQS